VIVAPVPPVIATEVIVPVADVDAPLTSTIVTAAPRTAPTVAAVVLKEAAVALLAVNTGIAFNALVARLLVNVNVPDEVGADAENTVDELTVRVSPRTFVEPAKTAAT
jgi:hypothetical protein